MINNVIFYNSGHHGCHAPLTPEQIKVGIGICIFLNILWAIRWIIEAVRYFKKGRRGVFDDGPFLITVLDMVMCLFWILSILYLAGSFIAKLL